MTGETCNQDANILGDGFCHDSANTKACQYDLGDCCRSYVNKTYCKECFCIDSNEVHIDPVLPGKFINIHNREHFLKS